MLKAHSISNTCHKRIHIGGHCTGQCLLPHQTEPLFQKIKQILTVTTILICISGLGLSCSWAQELKLGFSPSLNVSNTYGQSQAADIVLDPSGTVYTAWEEKSSALALFSRSVDNGATFTEPVALAPSIEDYNYGQVRLASSFPNEIHTTFTMFDLVYGGAEVVYSGSSNGGVSFSQPVFVSDLDTVNSYSPTIASGWATSIAWNDSNTTTGKTAIRYTQSEDGGVTFAAPKSLNNTEGVVLGPDIALWGQEVVYAVWTQNDTPFGADDGFEIFFTRSTDKGATFSNPVNISNNPLKSWRSRIQVDGAGTIYVVWVEGSYFAERQLLFTRSVDGGSTFDKPRVLVGPLANLETEPVIAANGDGNLWISWMEGSSTVPYKNFAIRSTDAGQTFSTATALPGPSYGIASINPHVLHTVWTQNPQGNNMADVFYGRGDISYDLFVTVPSPGQGIGSGLVTSDIRGISCANGPSGPCSASYLHGTTVTLNAATTTPSSTFTGWGLDCTGFSPCLISMETDRTVTASFGLGQNGMGPMAKVDSTGYDSIANAYNAVGVDATIQTVSGNHMIGMLALDRGLSVTIKGGYDVAFLTPGLPSVMQGKLTVQSGCLRVDNIRVQPAP